MIKASIDTSAVMKNLKDTLDLSKNFKPLMVQILGKPYDGGGENAWTLRGQVLMAFFNKRGSANGVPWMPLSDAYFKRKQQKYPGQPSLIRTRALLDSLQRPAGTPGAVQVMTNTRLIYGTTIPYATYLNSGTKYMASRQFMGVNQKTIRLYRSLISKYVKETFNGRKPGSKGVRA